MADLQIVGPQHGGLGTPKPFTASSTGSSRVSDAHGRYLDAVVGNRAFFLSVSAAAPTAYVGAAAGTPLLAIHNPLNSGKLLVALIAAASLRAAASAAGQTGLELWSGPSTAPTGTKTSPTNALSLTASGSSALGFSNAALTGSTALALAMPLLTHYWATAAAAFVSPNMLDIGGIVVAAPGNQIALGVSVVPTSLTVDAALYWEEIPYMPLG